MFLGGSYHDRDNPHMWGVSHGQLIVFIRTLVCIQKDGRQRSSSSRGRLRRTSVDEMTMLMMMMMTMTISYRGTGTKCTADQNLVTRNATDADDDDNTNNNSSSHSPTNPNTNNNNDMDRRQDTTGSTEDRSKQSMTASNGATARMSHPRTIATDGRSSKTQDGDHDATMVDDTNNTNNTRAARPKVTTPLARLDQREMTTRTTNGTNKQGRMTTMGMTERDQHTACDWYTRQKNQPSLNNSMPLQQQHPTQDTRSLADDTLVDGNRWNQPRMESTMNRTIADMDDDHNLT
jgi:hypothetical protein